MRSIEYMTNTRLIALLWLMLTRPHIYGQAYKSVVENFYNALGKRDFSRAYALCTGPKWGTLQQFSAADKYGAINGVALIAVTYKKQSDAKKAEAKVEVLVKDSINGDGRYIQNFTLVQKENKWLIKHISLLQTDRATNGWNFKPIVEPGLDKITIKKFLKPIYDTIKTNPSKLQITVNDPRFFQTPSGVYAVIIIENASPEEGVASVGWCDAFVFEQKDKRWLMTDFKLHAGGGGMYGNAGGFKNLLQAGKNVVALAIAGGQMHMGDFVEQDDLIAIEAGKLYNLTSIVTLHRYGEFGSDYEKNAKICNYRDYSFIKSAKKNYDLQIILSSCLIPGQIKEIRRAVIPWFNQKYNLPKALVYEPEGN